MGKDGIIKIIGGIGERVGGAERSPFLFIIIGFKDFIETYIRPTLAS